MVKAELKVVGGKQHGTLIPLESKKFLVGREQDCQLRPTSESVSRHHCVFSIDEYGVRLRDLGSTNGTYVNGQRLTGPVNLQSGDQILIGKLEFEIILHGVAAPTRQQRIAAASIGSSSDTGFLLSDLAEVPESAIEGETIADRTSTKVLETTSNLPLADSAIISNDNTTVSPVAAAKPSPESVVSSPTVQSASQTPAPPPPSVSAPIPAMAVPAVPGMPGYGMPGMYPQPTYLQAPYASFAPPYMPNPYAMQPQFLPQPGYLDPAMQQQLAYQQQLAQQAMMSPFGQSPAAEETDAPEESASKKSFPAISLPPPEETGIKAPPPAAPPPTAEKTDPAAPPKAGQEKPNKEVAADIIKKYMSRG